MEENKELIMSFCIAAFIPIIYMIFYLIKGKEKGILAFLKTLLGTLSLYVSSIIPIMLVVISWTRGSSNDFISICILDVLAIIFSTPFFAEMIKCIKRDFRISFEYESKLLLYIPVSIFLIAILIGCVTGFIAGEVSILALMAVLYLFVGFITVMIISIYKAKFAENDEMLEKIRKIERKVGIVLAVLAFLLCMASVIFYS